jgi:hypothetical protein
MNADEKEIYDFLRTMRNEFVSVLEISKHVGAHKRYLQDRTWARPLLRRMEVEGLVESNPMGEYRIKPKSAADISFTKALLRPDAVLGDTTIICLDKSEEEETSGSRQPV